MARKKLNDEKFDWYPNYPRNLLAALSRLPADQKLVYQIVLLRIYDCWGPCPDTDDALRRQCDLSMKRFRDALSALLSTGKLGRTAAGLTNNTASEIMAEQEATRERLKKINSEKGKKAHQKDEENQQNGSAAAQPRSANLREVDSLEGLDGPSTAKPPDEDLFGGKPLTPPTSEPKLGLVDLKKQLYDQGKLVLGEKNYGALIAKLLQKTENNAAIALAHLTRAAATESPRGYLSNFISGRTPRARGQLESRNGFAALAVEMMQEGFHERDATNHKTIDHDESRDADTGYRRLAASPPRDDRE